MAAVLDAERPDFVVYLGDLVTANNVPIPSATLYWDRALSPARSRGIPWATVFDNHDDMPFEWPSEWFSPTGVSPLHCSEATMPASGCSFCGTPRMELMTAQIHSDAGLSRSSVGPQELWPGLSNYVLQVLPQEKAEDPALLMYFLDSGGGSYPEFISAAEVRWFQSQSQFLNLDGRQFSWGHNHGLDWCCQHDKLWLCFARHTGHGGYGSWPRGARVVEMSEKPFSIESWIRMENGSTHSHIILS